jgi:hypothetical protein
MHEVGKRIQKGCQKGWKKGPPDQGIHSSPFLHLFFSISPRIACRTLFFFRFSTLFVLLIEKGEKNCAKNKENGKKGEKGYQKGQL